MSTAAHLNNSGQASAPQPSALVLRTLVIAITLVVLLVLGELLLGAISERLLRRDSESTAIGYARTITQNVPGVFDVLEHRRLDPATAASLVSLREVGDVFRFKLFDRDGNLLLTSNALPRGEVILESAGEPLGGHHGGAAKVVRSIVLGGSNYVELEDGSRRPGHPPLYSEAYVPLSRDGRLAGVIEVYVDQTARAQRVHEAFLHVAFIFGASLLIVGGTLAWQWQQRRRELERRNAQERIRYLARHDMQSGALNRTSFHESLHEAARRHGDGGPRFAALCIDLDHFEEVNDFLGHEVGNAVLYETTERLRKVAREGDVVARLGRDEFAIMHDGVADGASVGRLGQRVVDAMAVPFDVGGHRVVCTASVGAATFGDDASTIEALLHKAEVAMYRAKSGGRCRFRLYDARLDRELDDRRALARDLREAIDNGSLELHYQPLFEAADLQLVGYEALMRWNHPQRGPIPPGEFIRLAESSGQIEALGTWALHRACAEAATWPAPLSVSVNLSATQFCGDKDLTQVVRAALRASGLSPRRLELEITESLLMNNTDAVVDTLSKLSALGVRIAMDDFGTGHSSLSYLWRFAFDKVKIDRAFTIGLGENRKVELIVRSIVSLAHSMGIRVNTEGVETAPQMLMLQELGCDELQGYLLGKPARAGSLRHDDKAREHPSASGTAGDALVQGLPVPLRS